MKLLIFNLLESGKSVITLDAEHEQQEMCEAVGGCFADLMAGKYIINVLEPKCWDDGGDPDDTAAPEAFRKSTLLAQHVSFLKDFFRAYKDFSDAHIDTIEIMVSKLYAKWGITERSNFRRMRPEDYPILSDLYDLIEEEFKSYDPNAHLLYTEKLLQEVLLGLHSMCKGADAQFFNGHTNITSSRFLVFGVKGMLSAAKNVRNAMLFNVLSFMSDKLLTVGNTVAALDELYIWLSNPTAIEYIRNCLKRVRKKESAMLLASQNLEDFDQEQVREMTKPLFSIRLTSSCLTQALLTSAATWRCSSWMRRSITSSSSPSAVSACTSAEMSATCWRYMLRHIRKSCLERRVVADGSICRHDRKSRGDGAL